MAWKKEIIGVRVVSLFAKNNPMLENAMKIDRFHYRKSRSFLAVIKKIQLYKQRKKIDKISTVFDFKKSIFCTACFISNATGRSRVVLL